MFKAYDTQYFAQGLRLVAAGRGSAGYTGIWRPGEGAQWWRSGMTWSEFKTLDAEHFKQGLRLQAVDKHNSRIMAVWRPGSGGQWCRSMKNFAEFKKRTADYFNEGYHLVTHSHNNPWVGVYKQATGANYWAIKPVKEFKPIDDGHFAKGRRLVFLSVGYSP
jgi:hypothetical protein